MVKKRLTEGQIDQIISKAKERVIGWSKTNAGTKLVPPPPPPLNPDDNHSG